MQNLIWKLSYICSSPYSRNDFVADNSTMQTSFKELINIQIHVFPDELFFQNRCCLLLPPMSRHPHMRNHKQTNLQIVSRNPQLSRRRFPNTARLTTH